jgi:hypothetical protein
MDVLRWMKGVCVVTTVLGVVGYLIFLGRWIYTLVKEHSQWLESLGYWLSAAAAPLVVILLSVIGYSLCCLAVRFRLPRVATPLERDYADPPPRA